MMEMLPLKVNLANQIFDIRGKTIETQNSPKIEITGEVVFIKKQKNNYEEINLKLISE